MACVPAYSQLLPSLELLSRMDENPAEVAVQGNVSLPVVNEDHLSVAFARLPWVIPACKQHASGRGSIHGLIVETVIVAIVPVVVDILAHGA